MDEDTISTQVRACKQALNEAEMEAYKEDVPVDTERLVAKVREASVALAQISHTDEPLSKADARAAVLDDNGAVDREGFEYLHEGMREKLQYLAPPSEDDLEFMRDALDDRLA